ncbi:reverse transcriptase domain-containing protein [Tanacetum coccineum]
MWLRTLSTLEKKPPLRNRDSIEILISRTCLEVGWIRRIHVLDTAYWGFLGVGTTHGYVVSSLMDTMYWSSETVIFKISSFKLQNARLLLRYTSPPLKSRITDQPIKHILSKTEASGKLEKYVVELGAYNITFVPRNAVKGQVLIDFLSESPEGEKAESYFRMPEGQGKFGFIGPSGIEYTYALRLTFPNTNNKAEYEALLAGLRIALKMNISNIEVRVDSKLVASQINGSYEASKDNMIKYLAKAKEYISDFK